jgi:hypothetical protein
MNSSIYLLSCQSDSFSITIEVPHMVRILAIETCMFNVTPLSDINCERSEAILP